MPGSLPQILDDVQSRPVTRDDFRSSLGATRASADPVAGIFGPGSMIWKVNTSTLVYGLGITQAAFMDVAHPVIANGIADHSTIFVDPHARAHQTYSMLTNLVFGDRDLVVRTSRALFTIHERIRGAARADEGRYASGEEYVANEGNVLLWVHATMWWVRLQTYRALVGGLTAEEREQYYRETCELAGCFAIPADLLPVDHDAWDAYVRNGPPDALAASDDSRRIMAHLRAQVPAPARAHLFAFNSVLLPDRVRTVLGLPELTPRTLRRHRQLAFLLRWAIRLLPGPLGELPPRRAAFARIAGRPQDPISRAIGRVLAGPPKKSPTKKSPTRRPLRRTR
ncbi:MAG TPA: oxygenase MpaB family protein [Nocardioides sp.]